MTNFSWENLSKYEKLSEKIDDEDKDLLNELLLKIYFDGYNDGYKMVKEHHGLIEWIN